MRDVLLKAARNNALWCDAVCGAQGAPGEFRNALWLNRSGTPLYYPDVVTLAPAEAAAEQIEAIAALVGSPDLNAEALPLLLTIDWFLDRCRTTVNVLGDMTVAVLIDRSAGKVDFGLPLFACLTLAAARRRAIAMRGRDMGGLRQSGRPPSRAASSTRRTRASWIRV